MSDLERWVTPAVEAEFRVADGEDGGKRVIGYFGPYNSLSVDLGGFREFIKPGAFNRNFSPETDVRSLFNHDKNLILGRTSAGTHRLSANNRGGLAETDIDPEMYYAASLLRSIKRGDITGMSFGFRTISDEWSVKDGQNIRALVDVSLHNGDTSPVTFPAYPSTTVNVRSEIQDAIAIGFTTPVNVRNEIQEPIEKANALAAVLIRFDKKLELQEGDVNLIREYRSIVPGRFEPFVSELVAQDKRGASFDYMRRRIEIVQAELTN